MEIWSFDQVVNRLYCNISIVRRVIIALIFSCFLIGCAKAERLKIAVTTSFDDSGLAQIVMPAFKQKTGLELDIITVGSGQALKLLANGDVDGCLVHSRVDEERLVASGKAVSRRDVMYNVFLLIGPDDDPAKIATSQTIAQAMKRLFEARNNISFISRGDDSGTYKRELLLWHHAGIDIANQQHRPWYKETGAGMGTTLNIAVALDGYTMVDRGTWLKFGGRDGLKVLFQGDKLLINQYGYLLINPEKFPNNNFKAAKLFGEWLTGSDGQKVIGDYKLSGEQLFFPNAQPAKSNFN